MHHCPESSFFPGFLWSDPSLAGTSRLLWLTILLLLLIWAVRIFNISAFPPFIDETIHVYSTERFDDTGILFNAGLLRQFSLWWYAVFAPTSSADPMAVSRLVTVLCAMIGIASAIGTARLVAGHHAALFTAIFYGLGAYHFFFERLALADNVSSAMTTASVYFAARLIRRTNYGDAFFCGATLFLAFGAKTNALPFFIVPWLAILFLPRPASFHQRRCWLAIAVATSLGLSLLFVFLLHLRGYDYLFSSLAFAVAGNRSTSTESVLQLFDLSSILHHTADRLRMLLAYSGVGYMLIALSSLLFLVIRRRWFLFFAFCIPVAVLLVSGVQESRYWVTPLALLAISMSALLAHLVRLWRPFLLIVYSAIVVWLLTISIPIMLTLYRSPLESLLFDLDIREYIAADGAGSGLDDVISVLQAVQPMQVYGALANCDGLRYRAWRILPIECLLMRPDGQDRQAIASFARNIADANIYLVLETSPYAPSVVEGDVIATVTRPGGMASLTIYRLLP